MPAPTQRRGFPWPALGLTALAWLAWTGPAPAQVGMPAGQGFSGGGGFRPTGGGFGGTGFSGGGGTGFSGGGLGNTGFGGAGFSGGGFGNTGFGGGAGFSGGGIGGSGFSGGAGFAGGTGFSGGAGFSGGSSFGGFQGGTSFAGGTGGGFAGGGYRPGGVGTGVSQANPFYSSYANFYAQGLSSGAAPAFGQPIYGQLTTGTTTGVAGGVGGLTGTAGISGAGVGGAYTSSGFAASSVVGVRAPAYATAPAFPMARPVNSRLVAELQDVIARSSRLPSRGNIRITAAGAGIVLQGTVSDEHEKRLAEALVRLTPGVHDVRNDLQIEEALPTPRRGP